MFSLRWMSPLLLGVVLPIAVAAQEEEARPKRAAEASPREEATLVEAAKAYAEIVSREAANGDETAAKRIYGEALSNALQYAQDSRSRVEAEAIQTQIDKLQARLAAIAPHAARTVSPRSTPQPAPTPASLSPEAFLNKTKSILEPPRVVGSNFRVGRSLPRSVPPVSVQVSSGPSPLPLLPDYYSDPEWIRNSDAMLDELRMKVVPKVHQPGPDGEPSGPMDCVAINTPGGTSWICCSATLVRKNILISAAHCVPCDSSQVYIGHDSNDSSSGKLFDIEEVIPHPDFDEDTLANDVAIVVLKDDVPADVAVPRAFATKAETESAKYFTVVGFGWTDQGNIGRKFGAPVAVVRLRPQEIRAGGFGFDACQGDSGGPLYFGTDETNFKLAGITSYGGECGLGGVWVRIDAFRDWIDDTIEEHESP